jgi:peptidoglycan/LPS O-acetylase OafA/YrhL
MARSKVVDNLAAYRASSAWRRGIGSRIISTSLSNAPPHAIPTRKQVGRVGVVPTRAETIVHPDATATGKPHYEVLDGLRGTAAIMVVLFHIMGMPIGWADQGQYLHHAAMAVDFFFGLSGFVVAYAYDARWGRMSVGQFVAIRLIRLHPLVLLGALLGLASFLIDPFAANQKLIPLGVVLRDFALACLLLPHAPLPNRWTDTHSLNSPAWSLLQEYVGNLVYAIMLRRLGTRALGAVMTVAAATLLWLLWRRNSIDMGSDWTSWWGAPARMAFSFTMGLWLYRVRERMAAPRLGWIVLSALLVIAFAVPLVPNAIPHGNGIYEAACLMLLFPAIILSGAHSRIGPIELALCKLAGRISYPIYILHYPFLLIYMNFALFRKPPEAALQLAAGGVFLLVMAFSWLALRLYDGPVRAWLRARLLRRSRAG